LFYNHEMKKFVAELAGKGLSRSYAVQLYHNCEDLIKKDNL
jgi:hypothetical protein